MGYLDSYCGASTLCSFISIWDWRDKSATSRAIGALVVHMDQSVFFSAVCHLCSVLLSRLASFGRVSGGTVVNRRSSAGRGFCLWRNIRSIWLFSFRGVDCQWFPIRSFVSFFAAGSLPCGDWPRLDHSHPLGAAIRRALLYSPCVNHNGVGLASAVKHAVPTKSL